MNYHTMSYLAAVAALTGNLPAYDVPIYQDDRIDSRSYSCGDRVLSIERREAPIETAYSSMMRNYYDSVWQDRRPTTQVIVIEK